MRNYVAFIKKECMESSRTYKVLCMFCVFFLFGMMSPVSAKIMPKLLESFMTNGIKIILTTPVVLDAWVQFYKNVSQMGLMLMIILFSGILATEVSKGTLIIMVTKGLSRDTIILSKLTVMVLLWSVSYLVAGVTTWGYARYLFPGESLEHLVFSMMALWLYGVFLLALLIFMSTFTRSNYSALLLTGVVVVLLMILNMLPILQKYNPLFLSSNNVALLGNTVKVKAFFLPMGITGGCIILLTLGAILIFRKRQL